MIPVSKKSESKTLLELGIACPDQSSQWQKLADIAPCDSMRIMPMCSICSRGEETAGIVNDLLDQQTPLKEIEKQTGLGFRSISRHKRNRYRKNCPFGYQQHRLDRLRLRRDGQTRRLVVQWMMDGGKLTTVNKDFSAVADPRFSLPVAPNELRKDDILICVEFENLPTRKPRDPVKPENDPVQPEN